METKLEYEKPILLEDLGMRFPNENSKEKKRFGLFKCFCGNEFDAQISVIKAGLQKSCGCLKNQDRVTHRLSKHRLYVTWDNMMQRCHNPNYKRYKDYGGRGITVCERWHSIENFVEDMFPTFEEGLTLDRIDVDGNYETNNCRWTTKSVQTRNTRLLSKNNKSGFRGVSWYKKSKKWEAQIKVNSLRVSLGYFKTPLEASYAYDLFVYYHNLEHTTNHPKESYTEEQLSQPQKPLPINKNKSQE